MQRGSQSLGQSQPLVTVDGLNISLCCMFLSVSATKLLTVINDGACGMWAASSAQPNAATFKVEVATGQAKTKTIPISQLEATKKTVAD